MINNKTNIKQLNTSIFLDDKKQKINRDFLSRMSHNKHLNDIKTIFSPSAKSSYQIPTIFQNKNKLNLINENQYDKNKLQ